MIGNDGFDHFNEDDFNYDDTMPPELHLPEFGSVTINAEPGHVVQIHGRISVSVFGKGDLRAAPATVKVEAPPVAAEDPKDLFWTPFARFIMSPTRFREEWLRHVSDMNFERHECLKRGNLSGARWAVIRAHVYSLPIGWLLIPVRFILHLVKHWAGF
jgi:hypothetical protein